MLMALGHAVAELPVILLVYFGFGRYFENEVVRLVLSVLGGAMIIWMGIAMFRAPRGSGATRQGPAHNAFVAGILTSLLNPFFWIWWATIGSMLVMKIIDFGIGGLIAVTLVHWSCDLLWLCFVSVLIYRTRALWGQKLQEGMFIACSLLLAGFGAWYLISGILLVV
jgi:threonine/homoserine/homoserine lactone efflux protein